MINKTVDRYYSKIIADCYHRYHSWEYCYKCFQSNPTDFDFAALNLGMYLASWGMYRGSTLLLKKNYKFLVPIAQEVLSSKYAALNNAELSTFKNDKNIELLFSLIKNLQEKYQNNQEVGDRKNAAKATDTLITKILLGTLGCIPAYDRFFIKGLKFENGLGSFYLNKRNFKALINWCNDNEQDLLGVQKNIIKKDFEYPLMKIVDMYFWQIGYEQFLQEKAR